MCRLRDSVGVVGEFIICKTSLDPFPLSSNKASEDLKDGVGIEQGKVDKCSQSYNDDLVYKFDEIAQQGDVLSVSLVER